MELEYPLLLDDFALAALDAAAAGTCLGCRRLRDDPVVEGPDVYRVELKKLFVWRKDMKV